ncbi:MAG: DUF3800 domain-containing protein [Chloroflexi bacterium]|nr:DUF3800 domain-containing protein [Chloroflexota bacterium]
MKFCYLDETGLDENTTVVIAVGVVVDVQRMNRTKVEWGDLFTNLSSLTKKRVKEIHAKDLIPGRNAWYGVAPEVRVRTVDTILDWIAERKHLITFAAVDKEKLKNLRNDHRKADLKTAWDVAAFHVVLTIQRAHQKSKNNKGHTLFIFDKGQSPENLIGLIMNPPAWSETYYSKSNKQEALDQIIDVPFYAESHHVPLVQVADLVCYILRRFTDLESFASPEKYEGERNRYKAWVEKIVERDIGRRHRYQKKQACDVARFFNELAPDCLTAL